MVYTLSYQMYKYEHGLSAGERRAADVRAGEAAAALWELRSRLGRAFQPHRLRSARRAAGGAAGVRPGLARVSSGAR